MTDEWGLAKRHFDAVSLLEAVCNSKAVVINTDDGNVNVIAFVDDWDSRDYDTAAYAVTTVWHNTDDGEIYDVDMAVNEQRGTYGVCPAPGVPTGVDLAQIGRREPAAEKRLTAQLLDWLKDRKLVPVVGQIFPFADFRDAFKTMQTRGALGKMVVRIA